MRTTAWFEGNGYAMRAGQRGWLLRAARAGGAVWALAIVVVLSSTAPGRCQSRPGTKEWDAEGDYMINHQTGRMPDVQPADPAMAEKRLQALNVERQKRMVADASKLLALAKELNDEVAASNPGSFTVAQLRKIGEIEKLARSVRERMTARAAEMPSFSSPPTLVDPVHSPEAQRSN